jgi:class 3 adenylate cyclase
MWGATVDLANRVQTGADQGGIYVTARVYDALGEEHRFVQTGEVVGTDGAEPVWRLIETQP